MTETRRTEQDAARGGVGQYDPAILRARVTTALRRRLARARELSPRAAARIVAAAVPAALGVWLLRRLEEMGWLARDAVVPFDVLDRPDCPSDLGGVARELVRLAVFGLPGQGLAARDKRRWDVYQQLCAEIMSTAVDTASLRAVAARALNHPEVCADPALGSLVRQFIAEREGILHASRTTPEEQHSAEDHESKLTGAFSDPAHPRPPTRDEILDTFGRLRREFDGCLARYDDARAAKVLERLRDVRQHFPVHVPATDLQQCEEQYDRLLKRAGTYRRQIKELADQAAEAARGGNLEKSSWVIRRLEAIHSLLPTLLPEKKLDLLRKDILHSSRAHESEEAAGALREKKRAVVTQIKDLAGVVHRFHELAARLPPEDEAYRRAEANYRAAIEVIRGLDTEWLTGLVLELEALMEDLEDPSGAIQSQLDQFIANVRTALNRLVLEIRARQRASAAASNQRPPAPPANGASPPSPP